VFIFDEHFPGHTDICHRAKFERNWTIHSQVMVIYLTGLGCHPPFLIFEESIFGPLHTLWDPIVFAHTNSGDNILIGVTICSQNGIQKMPINGSQVYQGSPSGTFVCVTVQNFSQIEQSETKLQQFNLLDTAAVRHIELLKKVSLDHSAHCGLLLSTYTLNLAKIA